MRDSESVECVEVVGFNLDRAVGSFGEGFADGGSGALGASGEDYDFAAVFLFELEGFFEGVGIGLVHGELDVRLFDRFAGAGDANLGIAIRNLFDADDDFHP